MAVQIAMCTTSALKPRNIDCKNPPINEPSLIDELIELIDKIDLDDLGVKTKIEQEISRFNKFRIGVLGQKNKLHTTEIDIRNYAKYLLTGGDDIRENENCSRSLKANYCSRIKR